MKVTKISITEYKIEFDESEIATLDNLESVFEQNPGDLIRESVTQSLRIGHISVDKLIDRVHARVAKSKLGKDK